MASNNSKLDTEMKMAGFSFFIAVLVFIFLKFLTSEIKRLQTNMHKEEKKRRCVKIRAEQIQALKNIQMKSQSRISPFACRIKSDSTLLKFCHQSQSFTLAGPQNSVNRTPQIYTNNENVFDFNSKRISRSMFTDATTPPDEGFTIPGSVSFLGRTETVKSFGPADNYKEWSLIRRDVEISAMNFDL